MFMLLIVQVLLEQLQRQYVFKSELYYTVHRIIHKIVAALHVSGHADMNQCQNKIPLCVENQAGMT